MLNQFSMKNPTFRELLVIAHATPDKFPEKYLPNLEPNDIDPVEDAQFFIETLDFDTSDISNPTYIKYILLNQDKQINPESEGQFAELPKKGYLWRVSVPARGLSHIAGKRNQSIRITSNYLIDLESVQLVDVFDEDIKIHFMSVDLGKSDGWDPLVYHIHTEGSMANDPNSEVGNACSKLFSKYIAPIML